MLHSTDCVLSHIGLYEGGGSKGIQVSGRLFLSILIKNINVNGGEIIIDLLRTFLFHVIRAARVIPVNCCLEDAAICSKASSWIPT